MDGPFPPWAAQMAQTVEFMFSSLAYRATVYGTGVMAKICLLQNESTNLVMDWSTHFNKKLIKFVTLNQIIT